MTSTSLSPQSLGVAPPTPITGAMTTTPTTVPVPPTKTDGVARNGGEASNHLCDKGYLCSRFKQNEQSGCPLTNCPYSHIPAAARKRLPTMVCHFYINARCLRENCQFFHGPRRIYEELRARGAHDYSPAEYMPPRDPLAALSPTEFSMAASKKAVAQLAAADAVQQQRAPIKTAALPPPPPSNLPTLPPPPPYFLPAPAPAATPVHVPSMAYAPQPTPAEQQPQLVWLPSGPNGEMQAFTTVPHTVPPPPPPGAMLAPLPGAYPPQPYPSPPPPQHMMWVTGSPGQQQPMMMMMQSAPPAPHLQPPHHAYHQHHYQHHLAHAPPQ